MTGEEMIKNPFAFYLFAYILSFSGLLIPGPMTAVSIANGYQDRSAGLKIAFGHSLIEVPLILVIYLGFTRFFSDPDSIINLAISFFGGVMLIYMGAVMFSLRKRMLEKGRDTSIGSLRAGIITTGGNPSFFIWWATVGTLLVINAAFFGALGIVLFIAIHSSADFLWYGLLGYGTHRSRHRFTPRFHQTLFAVLAFSLMGFGLLFIIRGLL